MSTMTAPAQLVDSSSKVLGLLAPVRWFRAVRRVDTPAAAALAAKGDAMATLASRREAAAANFILNVLG